MDKLRRVLSGREENEELGLTAQVAKSHLHDSVGANANVVFVDHVDRQESCTSFFECLGLSITVQTLAFNVTVFLFFNFC